MKYLWIYLLTVNALGFLLMLVDKRKARKRRWRIPESTLFLTAAIGGSVGSILGMYIFRHKTKHRSFTIGMPIILIIQFFLAMVIVSRLSEWAQ